MRSLTRLIALLVLVSGVLAVIPARASDNTFLGTTMGAALGGLLGSQFGHGDGRLAYTGLGVFTGGVVGNSIGRSMDRADSAYYGSNRGYYYGPSADYYASRVYEPTYVAPYAPPPPQVVYIQPEVVEVRRGAPVYIEGGYLGSSSGNQQPYCREFTQNIRIGDEVQESYGTACLQPDGSWKIQR